MSNINDFVIENGNLFGYLGNDTEVVVPEGVTEIHYDAFHGNKYLTRVVLPNSINIIHIHAFEDCTGLQQILLPEKPVAIHPTAFQGCQGLADEHGFVVVRDRLYDYFGTDSVVVIPEGVRDIGMVFYGNTNIASVVLPKSLACHDSMLNDHTDRRTILEIAAFRKCVNLETIYIPEGIRWIPAYFLKECSKLKELRLPDSVRGMDINALDDCHSLELVTGLNVTQIREVKAENPLCNKGGIPVMICPQMPLQGVYKCALKNSLTLGFFINQELFAAEIAEEYKKYAFRSRIYLLPDIFHRDLVQALAFYDQNKKIKPKDFEKEWLEPAQNAGSTKCISWLLDWRSRHSPRKDPFAFDL